jgi:hypothetical protein
LHLLWQLSLIERGGHRTLHGYPARWPLENWQWDVIGAALVVGIIIGFAVPLVT